MNRQQKPRPEVNASKDKYLWELLSMLEDKEHKHANDNTEVRQRTQNP